MERVKIISDGHPKNAKVFAGEADISTYVSRVEIVIDARTGEASVMLTCPYPEIRIEGELKRLITEESVLVEKTVVGESARSYDIARSTTDG